MTLQLRVWLTWVMLKCYREYVTRNVPTTGEEFDLTLDVNKGVNVPEELNGYMVCLKYLMQHN